MREICKSGSEGGGALTGSPYPYNEWAAVGFWQELGRASHLSPGYLPRSKCMDGKGVIAGEKRNGG